METTPPPEAAMMIQFDPDIEFSHRDVGSRTQVIAHHAATGKFFQLGTEEYRIASLLDGRRTISDVMEQLAIDGVDWDPNDVAELIKRFVTTGVARNISPGAGPQPPQPIPKPTASQIFQRWLPQSLSMVISQRIPLLQGEGIASWLERRVGAVFSVNGMCVWCVLVASGLLVVSKHHREFGIELRRMFDPGMWMILFAMWAIAKTLHELGHAVAAKYHGVRVGKIGIMFFLFAPLAYVDVTDAWKLRSRWSRVQIALGGVYVELAFAAVAAWTWWFLPPGIAKHLAAQFFLVAGPATILVNANPLLRLDGYYVIADLTEIPNLRMHGRSQCGAWIEKWLVNIPSPRPLLSGWRRSFATVHAVSSVVFQLVWMSGLVIGVSIWAKGLGVALAIVAVLLWAALPLAKWIWKVWNYQSSEKRLFTSQRYRLVMLGFLVFTAFPSISYFHSPFQRRVPVVVQFRDEQIARAAVGAFVKRVYVSPGQRVDRGMILIKLENPDLRVQRDQKADDLKLAELRAIQFRRQESLSRAASEIENADSLRRQLIELDEQIDALTTYALRDGFVIGRGIERLPGRFVEQGEELLRVADPQEKELLASIGPSDVEAYRQAIEVRHATEVRLRGGLSFSTTPAHLRPRASVSLPHPALAATVGGPLAVEPSPNEGEPWRVASPQMQSITHLDPITSLDIQAGQIGTMTIQDNHTIASRIFEALSH
ncbi:Peptidase family M50 [Rubripirellula tenax]|uniref:Peptidase family M50 n=1 Tax=Rubripirellula tenax TaxID=2528015 RepID=A0A5C6FIN6_9BACT|nr:site-2 protease family protein [Rubripirellula tenax]TWU59919.1 Peptidase family M50 [Rubripirellula tenax]